MQWVHSFYFNKHFYCMIVLSKVSLIDQSRTKILFSGKLDELKKSLSNFTSVSAKTREFQANSCKINAVISSKNR